MTEITTIDTGIDGKTGFNEPVDLAHIRVRDGDQVAHVLAIRNYHRRDRFGYGESFEEDVWVSECWALQATEEWDVKKFIGGAGSDHNELFHWARKGLVEWEEISESVREHAHLLRME